MKKVHFNVQTKIDNQNLLREIFQNDSIYLSKKSNILLHGDISLGSNISFSGKCTLMSGTVIEDGVKLFNVFLGENCLIRPYSLISDTKAGFKNIFGPFCFIRDNSFFENNNIIGAHVELTRSKISSSVKISHRAFVADVTIHNDVIIGAGVIFCNYDGNKKCSSIVESSAIVGSGSLIISPIIIKTSAIVAAGSVVTKNVEAHAKFIQKRSSVDI